MGISTMDENFRQEQSSVPPLRLFSVLPSPAVCRYLILPMLFMRRARR